MFLVCHGAQYWTVRSNTTVDCPTGVPMESMCHLRSDIAANNSKYFVSNTQMNFLALAFTFITSDTGIWVGTEDYDHLHNITVIGEHTDGAIIPCKGTKVGFSFLGIENFTFSRLSITQCGFNIAKCQGLESFSSAISLCKCGIEGSQTCNTTECSHSKQYWNWFTGIVTKWECENRK